jgi:hypothetical protein
MNSETDSSSTPERASSHTGALPELREHPLLSMWKDRLEAEVRQEEARTARRVRREAEHASWLEAWRTYKDRKTEWRAAALLPRWWNLRGWLRWLLRLHAPGRPN